MNKKLLIIGAGGHGKVVADIASKNGYDQIEFLDDTGKTHCGIYPVVGESPDVHNFDCDVIVAIGDCPARKHIQESIPEDRFPVLIHPDAVVADTATIGAGTVVMACAVINPYSVIGKGCIINTASIAGHDTKIGDFCHIASGARVAGWTEVGELTWVGLGSSIIDHLHIASNCMIGAGAVVIKDITNSGTYVGVPARKIK